MTILKRLQSPVPRFYRKLRKIGLVVTAVSAALLTAPLALPATLVTAAGYLAVAGTVLTAVSQTTTGGKPPRRQKSGG